MALKFNIEVTPQEVEAARSEQQSFQKYEGPRPPIGFYVFKLGKVWAGQNKDGTDVIIADMIIDDEENPTYNGCSILHRMAIPTDSSNEHLHMQIRSMDDFWSAYTGGDYRIDDFISDATAGRIIEDGEPNKMGTPLKSIGKVKFDKPRKARAKIKHSGEYNNIHYFDLDWKGAEESDPWNSDDDDTDTDLDTLLGGV